MGVGRRFRIVVIGASAGGIQAISEVLSHLPASFPLAIAIVQHRSLTAPSLLRKILQRETKLNVKDAEDGDEINPGIVYLAPPGHHLVIDGGLVFRLTDGAKVRHVRPSADVLFASAAEALGSQVIALVLTGGDGDGSDGIQVVKDRGGTVISQDATTAQVSGMPESAIATGDVDYVVQLADIASVLQTLARQGAAAEDVAAL